jgi:LysR family transcriptional regulator, glycine cleavage system transcriptional activator
MVYRLPPLNSLRLFEAAGRHLSFKNAAAELNVTPSAVSHAIQALEAWLDCALFQRSPRGLALSPAGRGFLMQVRAGLDTIASASAAMPRQSGRARLAVSVAPSFGLRWLVPNLPRFGALHPEVAVSMDMTHRHVDFPRDADAAIRMGNGDWPSLYAVPLVREALVPVCAPELAARLQTPADLGHHTLLHVTSVREDWAAWGQLAGVGNAATLRRGLRFDTIHMALEAAAQGLGVAMGRVPLMATDVAVGRLVPVLGPPRRSRTGYWFVTRREELARPAVARFRDWIRAALRGRGHAPA